MFGATAGLLKLVGSAASADAHRLPMLVPVVALLVPAGLLGTAMNQRAYQIAPIAYSMPVVNVVDIIVAVLFGAVVFGELPGHSAALLGVQVMALVLVTVGLRLISGLRNSAPAPEGQLR